MPEYYREGAIEEISWVDWGHLGMGTWAIRFGWGLGGVLKQTEKGWSISGSGQNLVQSTRTTPAKPPSDSGYVAWISRLLWPDWCISQLSSETLHLLFMQHQFLTAKSSYALRSLLTHLTSLSTEHFRLRGLPSSGWLKYYMPDFRVCPN